MSDADRIRLTFQDLNNVEAVNLLYMAHDSLDVDIDIYSSLAQALVVTNVIMARQDRSVSGPTPGAGSTGAYSTARDMVTLEMTDATGSPWPVSFSGPSESIFTAGHVTVDPFNSDVAAMISWLVAFGLTKDGTALVDYNRGWRWQLSE